MSGGIGYGTDNSKYIGVTYMLPKRKKPCLVIVNGNTMTKVASFNDEESARMFFDFYAELNNCPKIDWSGDDVPIGLQKGDWNEY